MRMKAEEYTEIPEHYSYVTRSLLRLHGQGMLPNITDIDVEPEYGYTTRITYVDGRQRVTYGNDLGLNLGAASSLAADKGHTKFMLEAIGVAYPAGEEFLLPWWAERIGPSQQQRGNDAMRTIDQAEAYVEENLGYPVYAKPVSGSQGSGVHRVDSPDYLHKIFDEYNQKEVRVAIVEEAVNMPDYRIVTLDGELISAYRRIPLTVTGDGASTIRELVEQKQQRYLEEGRNTAISVENEGPIAQYLASKNMNMDMIPETGEEWPLLAVSNLSAGGTSEDVTERLHKRWTELAAYIAKNFNLRLCGVDLACEDITDADADASVLEVNATPGLDHYAETGDAQREIVDRLYARVLNALPAHA